MPDITTELTNIATEIGTLQTAVWAVGGAILVLVAGTVLFRLAKSAMGRV